MNNHDIEEGQSLNIDFTKLKKVADCGEELVPELHRTPKVARY